MFLLILTLVIPETEEEREKHYMDIKYFYAKLFLKCWLILD